MGGEEKAAFFKSAEWLGKDPITLLIQNEYGHSRGNKNDLKSLHIMISHLDESFENKVLFALILFDQSDGLTHLYYRCVFSFPNSFNLQQRIMP